MPELIDHGVTGCIVNNMVQAIEAARNIGAIDRRACRQAFEQRFTAHGMAERYLAVYAALGDARAAECHPHHDPDDPGSSGHPFWHREA